MQDTEDVTRRLTRTLTRWGAVSVLLGAAAARHPSPAVRAFGGQSAAWGGVDLAIAAVGAARGDRPTTRLRLRRILLVNAVLDVGYAATGAALVLRAPSVRGRLTRAQARGHGAAVVVQGAALALIDLTAVGRL